MTEIPEFVEMTIPFVAGYQGSVQAWGFATKGVCDPSEVDLGIMYDGLPDKEIDGAVLGFIKVRIPLRSMFEKQTVEGVVTVSKLGETA